MMHTPPTDPKTMRAISQGSRPPPPEETEVVSGGSGVVVISGVVVSGWLGMNSN